MDRLADAYSYICIDVKYDHGKRLPMGPNHLWAACEPRLLAEFSNGS